VCVTDAVIPVVLPGQGMLRPFIGAVTAGVAHGGYTCGSCWTLLWHLGDRLQGYLLGALVLGVSRDAGCAQSTYKCWGLWQL
jgi:hypothetical protein